MRIALVTNQFPDLSKTFTVDLVVGLQRLGHTVDLYAWDIGLPPYQIEVEQHDLLSRTTQLQVKQASLERRRRALPRRVISNILALGRVSVSSPMTAGRIIRGGPGLLLESDRTRSILAEYEALSRSDIIHCEFGTSAYPFIPIEFGKRRGRPRLVSSYHGYDLFRQSPGESSLRTMVFDRADGIVANGSFSAARLESLGCPSEKVSIVHVGFNIDEWPFAERTRPPGKPLNIVSVGRLVTVKGFEYSIRAVADLSRRHSISYRLIGEGPLRDRLFSMKNKLGLGDSVELVGKLTRTEIKRFLEDAHIVIQPSVTAENGQEETGGMAIREAAACGIPVVATRTGGISESVEDGVSGYLVQQKDSEAIVKAVEKLVARNRDWPEMGRAARRLVEAKFDREVTIRQMEKVYLDALG